MTTPGPQSTVDPHQPSNLAGDARPTHVHYVVLALAVAMAVLLYLARFAPTIVTPEIMADLDLSKSDMGTAVSAFFYAYALGQVPAGWLADRIGPRRALSLYVSTWSLAVAGMAFSRTLQELVAARFLLGLAQAGAYPTAAGLVKKWIPFDERGLASGAVTMGGRGGSFLSSSLTPYLMELMKWFTKLGFVMGGSLWRQVLVLYGLLGLVWALVFGLWFRNSPREHAGVNAAELAQIERQPEVAKAVSSPPPTSTPWRAIVTSRNVWLLCLVNFFVNIGWIFLPTWLATYLREEHNLSIAATGWLTAGTALAGMAGCLIGGWATDWLARRIGLRWGRRIPALISCGGAATAYLICFSGQQSTAVVIASAACAYFLADMVLGTVWATYQDIGSGSVGVVLGCGNMCGNFAAALFGKQIGNLAENGNWSQVMLIAAGSFAVAMVCWLFIDARISIVPPATQRD